MSIILDIDKLEKKKIKGIEFKPNVKDWKIDYGFDIIDKDIFLPHPKASIFQSIT